ncbi:MAG: 5-formyltetrahydrofolate cyclo-ligase [Bacillota bacterium]
MDKARLRREMLRRRQALSAQERAAAARAALAAMQRLLRGTETAMIYMPFRGELDPLPLARWLLAQGGSIALPITDQASRRITPAQVSSLDDLVPGTYGILEPAPGRFTELAPQALEVVIVPGTCFDEQGWRIGYGGGYYDRFLPLLQPSCLRIGYAYDWQVVERISPAPWDQRLDYIVTDRRCLRTARR